MNRDEIKRQCLEYEVENKIKSWTLLVSSLTIVLVTSIVICFKFHWALDFTLSIVTGLVLTRVTSMYHDYNHKSILTNSVVAEVLFMTYGLLVLAPKSTWIHLHRHHHRNNSRISPIVFGSFPILDKTSFDGLSSIAQKRYLASRHPVTILFSYFTVFIFSLCLSSFLENPKKHWDCGLALFLHISIISSFIFFGEILLLFKLLLIPLFIMSCIGGYVFYAQHNSPEIRIVSQNWTLQEAALISSSYIKMSPFWNWITANSGYHHIHHFSSQIPFYNLPKAMRNITAFQDPPTTSLKIREVTRCLNLKVWDTERNRLVSL